MLDLELMRVFLTAASCSSFTQAASLLYVSHSTVSRAIMNLEYTLGVRLFERTGRATRLTEAGKLLRERGGALLHAADALESDMRRMGNGGDGQLTIASLNLYSPLLLDAYRQVLNNMPQIDLVIRQMGVRAVAETVIRDEADLGVTLSFALPGQAGELIVREIEQGQFCAVVPEKHPLASRASVFFSDLRAERRLSLSGASYDFLDKLTEALYDGNPEVPVDSLESVALQVKAGLGVIALPEHVATQLGDGCRAIPISGLDTTYSVVIFAKKSNRNSALRLFFDQ